MSKKETNIWSFGRLDWNISRDLSSQLAVLIIWINNIGVFLEITAIIFFLFKFSNRKSNFRTPYFIIYTIGCICDAVPKSCYIGYLLTKSSIFTNLATPFQWYQGNFNSIWNVVLALNRFTAIFFYCQFKRLWSKRKTAAICFFLLIFPFLIESYKPVMLLCHITGSWCPESISDLVDITDFDTLLMPTLDCLNAIIATSLCSVAIICQYIRKKSTKDKILWIEKVLLLQTMISSMFLVLSAIFAAFSNLNGPPNLNRSPELTRIMNLQSALSSISNLFYAFYHYFGLVMLFALSSLFRREYLSFYTHPFRLLIKRLKKNTTTNTTIVSIISKTDNSKSMTKIVN